MNNRLQATSRRFMYEFLKVFGFFWLVNNIHGIRMKEPYNKMYQRENKNILKK
jgi:hypothetical protein